MPLIGLLDLECVRGLGPFVWDLQRSERESGQPRGLSA